MPQSIGVNPVTTTIDLMRDYVAADDVLQRANEAKKSVEATLSDTERTCQQAISHLNEVREKLNSGAAVEVLREALRLHDNPPVINHVVPAYGIAVVIFHVDEEAEFADFMSRRGKYTNFHTMSDFLVTHRQESHSALVFNPLDFYSNDGVCVLVLGHQARVPAYIPNVPVFYLSR